MPESVTRWDLLECPVPGCGSENIVTKSSVGYSPVKKFWRECCDCGIRGPEKDTWQEALTVWDKLPRMNLCPICEARDIERMRHYQPTERDIQRAREIEARQDA